MYAKVAVNEYCCLELVRVELLLVVSKNVFELYIKVVLEVLHVGMSDKSINHAAIAEAVRNRYVFEDKFVLTESECVAFDVVRYIGSFETEVEVRQSVANDIDIVEWSFDSNRTCDAAINLAEHSTEESMQEFSICVVSVDVEFQVFLAWRNPSIDRGYACCPAHIASKGILHVIDIYNFSLGANAIYALVPPCAYVGIAKRTFMDGEVFDIDFCFEVRYASAQHVVDHGSARSKSCEAHHMEVDEVHNVAQFYVVKFCYDRVVRAWSGFAIDGYAANAICYLDVLAVYTILIYRDSRRIDIPDSVIDKNVGTTQMNISVEGSE